MTKGKLNRIRPYPAYGLIFFVFMGFCGCATSSENAQIRLRWRGKTAVSVDIPKTLTAGLPADSVADLLKIRLVNSAASVSILGHYSTESDLISFTPLIPFTRGLRYEVRLRHEPIGTFDIPLADPTDAPKLLGIFPSQDTLPENLLKIYLRFSQPMQEGKSADYVFLVKNNSDTLKGAFLNLQPELWSEDRTMLTLWLDPGRIKRDLQPNRSLGLPLQSGNSYRLLVSSGWKDQQGAQLGEIRPKLFVASGRDSLSPVPADWKITPPQSGNRQPLEVDLKEPLDYGLLDETLSIEAKSGKPIKGNWEVGAEEKSVFFKPVDCWQAGQYTLSVLTVLEDLAGNNLSRPFDRDVTKKKPDINSGGVVKVSFLVAH